MTSMGVLTEGSEFQQMDEPHKEMMQQYICESFESEQRESKLQIVLTQGLALFRKQFLQFLASRRSTFYRACLLPIIFTVYLVSQFLFNSNN